MTLQTKGASRARTDAVVGAVVVGAAAIVLAAIFTLASGATPIGTSPWPQDIRRTVTQAESGAAQKAFMDFRLSEKGVLTLTELRATDQKALNDFRLSEHQAK